MVTGINPYQLRATNSPADKQLARFDTTTKDFTWVDFPILSLTTGTIPKAASAESLADSLIVESGYQIIFGGQQHIDTDTGNINVGNLDNAGIVFPYAFSAYIRGSVCSTLATLYVGVCGHVDVQGIKFFQGGTYSGYVIDFSGGAGLTYISNENMSTNLHIVAICGNVEIHATTGEIDLFGNVYVSALSQSKAVFTSASNFLISKSAASIANTGDLLAQTDANASILVHTTANDGYVHEYRISPRCKITAISAGTLNVKVSFTDENNAAQTISFFPMGLTSANLTTTGYVSLVPLSMRCYPNTNITLLTTFTGVSITYNAGATIESLF